MIQRLEGMGYSTLAPFVRHWKGRQGGVTVQDRQRLLPGYVFFERDAPALPFATDSGTDFEPDWNGIRRISGMIKILEYDNGQRALRDSDMVFVSWLKSLGSAVEMSLAIKVGSKVTFVSGPLQAMQGQIVAVNSKRKTAAVRFGGEDSLFKTVWCSFDYVASNVSDADGLYALPGTAP